MRTMRWQPLGAVWSEMNRLQDEMNRLFHRYSSPAEGSPGAMFPALNVWEDDNKLYVEAELPGLELKDLEIYVNGNQLTVKGERKRPELGKAAWHRQERGFGNFSRTLELPSEVDADAVEAELRHGVLRVELPKQTAARPRRIQVKSG